MKMRWTDMLVSRNKVQLTKPTDLGFTQLDIPVRFPLLYLEWFCLMLRRGNELKVVLALAQELDIYFFFWSQRIQLTWGEEIWKAVQIIHVQEETGTQNVHLSSEMGMENSLYINIHNMAYYVIIRRERDKCLLLWKIPDTPWQSSLTQNGDFYWSSVFLEGTQ